MAPGNSLDDSGWAEPGAPAWTVLARLRDRHALLSSEAAAARRRVALRESSMQLMTPASARAAMEDELKSKWVRGFTVVALLFAPPDSAAMKVMAARRGYFDIRTGNVWDLFCPGYFPSAPHIEAEEGGGFVDVEGSSVEHWVFSPRNFDRFRRDVEHLCDGRWRYSGEADLVLANALLVEGEEPRIDWASTIAYELSAPESGGPLTLATAIETITRDLEDGTEQPTYGLYHRERAAAGPHAAREFLMGTVSGIAAAIGAKLLGA